MTQKERRDSEMLYRADEEIGSEILRARRLTQQLNTVDRTDFAAIAALVEELFGKVGEGTMVTPPFYCDVGTNIEVGRNFFANYNCTVLDVAKVTVGDNCMLAPNVSIFTAGHPVHPAVRNTGYEYGIAVTIGDNVWVGGNAVICPGVHIGNNVVIGAGSVVTRDIPDNVIAAGNPCRVLRPITEEDRLYYYKKRPVDDAVRALAEETPV